MLKISYCCIYKDEEENLPRWIESAKAVGDEIIAVDTGSRDNSNEILKRAGITPLYYKWNDDFSAAKNYALSKATGDWIVFMDADEYFAEYEKVRRAITAADSKKNVQIIECNMHNIDKNDNDKFISSIFAWRIFRNMPTLKYKGRIHEGLFYAGKSGLKTVRADFIIYHTGYSTGLGEEKARRNLKLLELEAKGGVSPRLAHYLATGYMNMDDVSNAKKYAKLALSGADAELDAMPITMYRILLAAESREGNDFDKKTAIIEAGLRRFSNHPDLLYEKLLLFYEKKRYDECEKLCELIFERIDDANFMNRYESRIRSKLNIVYNIIYECCIYNKKYTKAANLAERRLMSLFAEAAYYYKRDGRSKLLLTFAPMAYLTKEVPESELTHKDMISLLQSLAEADAHLLLAYISMESPDLGKAKELLVFPILNVILTIFGESYATTPSYALKDLYERVIGLAPYRAKRRIASCIAETDDAKLKEKVANDFFNMGETALAELVSGE